MASFTRLSQLANGFSRVSLNTLVPSTGPSGHAASCFLALLDGGVRIAVCMWRDSTLLFQAVPGIAIFGYVGTWDTYRYAPFMFFGFLLCFATLFARAHARDMMMRARESGYAPTSLDADKPGGFLGRCVPALGAGWRAPNGPCCPLCWWWSLA